MRDRWRSWLLASLLICGLTVAWVCSGCSGGECRANDDCSGNDECLDPNPYPVCGIPAREDCADDGDCSAAGMVCHAAYDACSTDWVGSECRAACSTDEGCGTGFECGAGGACQAVSCEDGYECPTHQACDPSSLDGVNAVFSLHHGCVDVSCTGDSACPSSLVCVNSRCQTGPGSCGEPEIVP